MQRIYVHLTPLQKILDLPLPYNPLFISVRNPFKPVKAATIGHWLKNLMKAARAPFQLIQLENAAISKPKQSRVSMSEVLKAANWNLISTFCLFYDMQACQFCMGCLDKLSWVTDSSILIVSFEWYHAVNWLCCWNVSKVSRVQLQIPHARM